MKNKITTVRILAAALASVVVFLLNAGVVWAAEITIDEDCYFEYYNNEDNYLALGEKCPICITNPERAYTNLQTECKEKYAPARDQGKFACETGDPLSRYCDTLSGKQKTECNDCASKEPGLPRKSCESKFDTTKFVDDCKKEFDQEYELNYDICVIDGDYTCDACMDKLDAAAEGACKDFDEYIDELVSETINTFGLVKDKDIQEINECFEDEMTDDLDKCKTNDLTTINDCIKSATDAFNKASEECNKTKEGAMKECEKQQETFIDELCASATDVTACKQRNQNYLLTIYGQCTGTVIDSAKNCVNLESLKMKSAIDICTNKETLLKKDKDCIDPIIAQAKKECLPICGNGNVDPGEECDDANEVNDDECTNTCKKSKCGNGDVDPGEECDDKNRTKGDGCDDKCKKEDVFRVADFLKIDEGQSYLEQDSAEGAPSLKKGVVFLIISAIEVATKIIGALALLMVIIGGVVLMISSGNSQLQQKGKRIILYAILGLVIAFLSLVIVTFVQSLFYTA